MKKIVFLPLDERPCNYDFPHKLYGQTFDFIMPPRNILGDKKTPSDIEKVLDFTANNINDAEALIMSLEMFLYGGLLPSRLHCISSEEIENRLDLLMSYKEKNPKLKIYAFSLIMRCPKYSSDDEEPDYYGVCGTEIHRLGELIHRQKLGMEVDDGEIVKLKDFITNENLYDYTNRREINLKVLLKTLKLRQTGVIDHLIIPQDDSAPYGYTAMDQIIVRDEIAKLSLTCDVLMYPGADEAGLTIISRYLMEQNGFKPKVFVKYSASGAENVIPPYEDRPLGETVKSYILSSGGQLAYCISECDIVLALNIPPSKVKESRYQSSHSIEYDCFRNIPEFIYTIEHCIETNIPVMIGDNAYANGGELALLKILDHKKLLWKLAGYAGWNTNGNTLGTVISQGLLYLIEGNSSSHKDFLALRYVEDIGYCSSVRFYVGDNILKNFGYNYFFVEDKKGVVSQIVEEKLNEFISEYIPSAVNNINILNVFMPWRRMFEVGLDVKYTEDKI